MWPQLFLVKMGVFPAPGGHKTQVRGAQYDFSGVQISSIFSNMVILLYV